MVSEDKFHELVASWLKESFSEITHEPRLESYREPDFIVSTPFQSYVIEVEDTFEDIFTGTGQAMYYGAETSHEPVIVIPADEVEEPEYSYLDRDPDVPHIVTL